jgi:hypothetical protein
MWSEAVASGIAVSSARRSAATSVTTPSRISIKPTENSMERPTRGGITQPNRTIPVPTTRIVSVCPTPHQRPMRAALPMVRWRDTMVLTAST